MIVMSSSKKVKTIDEYIEAYPQAAQRILRRLRDTIVEIAPRAVESISYDMPTFKLNGKRLLYFAAWKTHVGLYSIPLGDEEFRKEIAPYQGEKGSLRFPLEKPIPYDLVRKIVKLRIKEIDPEPNRSR
jgi:uncharacterized protein YdhG (YjbR/CyaY superfamily)